MTKFLNETRTENWEECARKLEEINKTNSNKTIGIWYRGQSDANWALTSTLERAQKRITSVSEYFHLVRSIQCQIETFTGGKWEVPSYTEVVEKGDKYDSIRDLVMGAYSYLAHLRHHGFPSPFLDWSGSPYVAAYFAFRNALDATGNVAIFAYSEYPKNYKVRLHARPQIFSFGGNVKTHPRHFRQQSRYTICCAHSDDGGWHFAPHEEVFSSSRPPQDAIWKITVPASERIKVLREFDRYNLNDYTLFGSEEALMTTLATRALDYKAAADTSLS